MMNLRDPEAITRYLPYAPEWENGRLSITDSLRKGIFKIVYSYCGNSFFADDITQEILFKIWWNYSPHYVYNFYSWTISVIRNTIADHFKKMNRNKRRMEIYSENWGEAYIEN